MLLQKEPPTSETELLNRCQEIEGLTLGQLALNLGVSFPNLPVQRKGWAGMAIELALGANAKGKPIPDFHSLGIELKTLPVNRSGKAAESTFITSIPLLTIHKESWKTSQCFAKLQRILWIPIESDKTIPYASRYIGKALLWSPNESEEAILKADWEDLTLMISTGKLEEISATMGKFLQIRPKAANSKSLCYGFNDQGEKILTLPRGFYLRSSFTSDILKLELN